MRRITIALASALLFLFLTACKQSEPAAGAEKNYPLRGEVLRLDQQTKTATIKHEKIGDWMDAMTMDFPVHGDAEWAKLKPGAKITATVHTHPGNFEYFIDNIQLQP